MAEHQAYLETVAAQLAQWKATIEKMQAHVNQIRPMAKRKTCETKLETATHQHRVMKQKLDKMSRADQKDWEMLSGDMEQVFESLKEMLDCVDEMEHQTYDILSWSKDQAEDYLVKLIGWTEGVDEDSLEAVGWTDG